MELEIRLFTGLKCNNKDLSCFGEQEFRLIVPSGTTLKNLYDLLKLAPVPNLISLVNGLSRPDDWALSEGDRVGIFPPVGGG